MKGRRKSNSQRAQLVRTRFQSRDPILATVFKSALQIRKKIFRRYIQRQMSQRMKSTEALSTMGS